MSRAWRGGAGLAVLVAVAACGSASSTSAPTAQIIVQATKGVRTTRFTTTVALSSKGTADVSFEVRGAVDFAQRLGEMTSRPLHVPPGEPHESSTSRWIGDRVYVTGSAGVVGGGGGWTLIDTAKAGASASPCLAHGQALAQLTGGGASDPTTLLDELRRSGTDLQRVGSDTIGGVDTTHWGAAPVDAPSVSCSGHASSSFHTKSRVGFDVWIDDQNVARRLEITSVHTSTFDDGVGTHTDTFKVHVRTDFYALGDPVSVNPPPAQLVHDGTAAYIAMYLGPGTTKSSDWHVAARSAPGTPRWTVFAARTTTGWECYDASPRDSGGFSVTSTGFPEHDGRSATCSIPGGQLAFNGPAQVLVNRTERDLRTIVATVSGYGPARLEFADGTTAPLEVDPHTLLFTWTGSTAPTPVRVRVGAQACRVDGRGTSGPDDQYDATGRAECIGTGPF